MVDLLTERGLFTPDLAGMIADEALLSAFDVGHLGTEALLWQTGYLTFHGTRRTGARTEYRLGYPNLEVEMCSGQMGFAALYPSYGVSR